jgi:hypothetical protein
MAKKEQLHFEPYIYLPALTHDRAIVAWGGFFFSYKLKDGEERWDDEAKELPEGLRETIGIRSRSYGPARVHFTEVETGHEFAQDADPDQNHVVVSGLKPDTEYPYNIIVAGQEWAAGPRRDWNFSKNDDGGLWLESTNREYDNLFRTFPSPDSKSANVTFAVIGDFGRGVKEPEDPAEETCQGPIAEALEAAVDTRNVRFILTTGDNIYAGRKLLFFTHDEGEEDDDWFFTYFQPYRYIINRVPVFPAIGNHDSKETEREADRSQIYDNFFLAAPYHQLRDSTDCQAGRGGLFYRFNYGSDVEFFCVDTSTESAGSHFNTDENQKFLMGLLNKVDPRPRWRIVYSHHPPYCGGPRHASEPRLQEWMEKVGEPQGVRVFFSGHEHNFQYALARNVHYFLTGGGGKYRKANLKDKELEKVGISAWGGNDEGHFLIVEIKGSSLTATPIGLLQNGQLRGIKINSVGMKKEISDFGIDLPESTSATG